MPLENQSFNESPIQNNSQEKSNKFVVILIILILLAGSYLVYSIYNSQDSEASDSSTTVAQDQSLNQQNESNNTVEISNKSPIYENAESEQVYTLAQVAENNNKNSCWTIIDGNVYNITSYVPNHPGGESDILKICGLDGTSLFNKPSEHISGGARNILDSFRIGTISP